MGKHAIGWRRSMMVSNRKADMRFRKTWDKHPVMREVVTERKRKEADNTPLEGQISLEV